MRFHEEVVSKLKFLDNPAIKKPIFAMQSIRNFTFQGWGKNACFLIPVNSGSAFKRILLPLCRKGDTGIEAGFLPPPQSCLTF